MPPRVFISHSSKDKDRFVVTFAERLRDSGIHPWVDLWEIKPGDSLVRKIFDEGLGQADAVIVVVSENSIESSWVRAELDHAVVLRIEESIRLIPVVLGNCKVPEPLRSTLWVPIADLDNYEDDLIRIVDTLHGDTEARLVGSPPSYTQVAVPLVHGLRRSDVLVFKAIVELVLKTNAQNPGRAEIFQATSDAGIPEALVDESVEALAVAHLLEAHRMPTDHSLRFVLLESPAFRKYLRHFEDVAKITADAAGLIVNEGLRDGRAIAESLSLHPLLLFTFLEDLGASGLMEVSAPGDSNAKFGKELEILSVSPQFRRSLE